MPRHIVSNHTKLNIPALSEDGYTMKEICRLLGIKKTLVYRTLTLYKQFGVVYNPHTYSRVIRRHRILSMADITFISNVVAHRSTIYLDELQHELWEKRQVYATTPTLYRALRSLQLTRKKISFAASERNEELRARYMNRIGAEAPDANMLLFIDEAAKDRRTSCRPSGRSFQGQCCHGKRYFVRGVRYSILPAITLDGIITYDIIEGPVDSTRFLRFLQEHIVSLMHFKLIKMADLFRCLSLPHILDRAVSLSWIIVVFTKVKKFAHSLKTCTVRCYIYQILDFF